MEGIEWGSYWAVALPVSHSDSGLSIVLNPLGDVYLGQDIKMGQDITLKLEHIQTRTPRLYHKHTIYKTLANMPGIPAMHWYGKEVPYNVMVLDRLGLTLEEVITKCHNINLVFLYASQMDIIKGHSIEHYGASILEKKIASINTLCQGLPAPFLTFTKHIQSLGFDKKLQYDYLHTLLTQCSAHRLNEDVSNPVTTSPSFSKHSLPANCSLPSSGQILHSSGCLANVPMITRSSLVH
ncbi:hypothetical protein H4582DRAFT_2052369 [Lactarius indigo]|nr:hypothetical protein H4582DRAFT_2052369 [Lactarius indigo]